MPINVNIYNQCQKQECSLEFGMLEGQILAPMLVESEQVIRDLKLKRETLQIWRPVKQMNFSVLVAFIPVYPDEYEMTERIYKDAVENVLKGIRKPRSKYVTEIVSYETWMTTADDTFNHKTTSDLDAFFYAEMLQELLEKVRKADSNLYDITLGLLEKEFDEKVEDIFTKLGMVRSTGFYRLKKLRTLFSELLDEYNQ